MGTSASYNAPTSPQWRDLKREVTRLARQGKPSPTGIRGILQNYVKVNNGSSRVASRGGSTGRGRAAQSVARNIGQFFSSVADVGFRETFEQAGLGLLEGKSVGEIAHSLLAYLGGQSSTIDEVDARKALSDLMDEILDDADSLEDVEEAMGTISRGESLDDMIRRFFGYYLYEQFCRVFYERLVARIGDMQADEFVDEIRDYICNALKHVTRHQDVSQIDWNGSQGQQIADKLLQDTLEVFSTV